MSMYEFRDLQPYDGTDNLYLPPEALFVDGTALEELVTGYQTLNVSGRELMGYEITTTDRTGGDGKIFQSANLPDRKIIVRFKLAAPDPGAFRQAFNRLNYFLSKPQFEASFHDEADVAYTATLSDVDDVPEGRNDVVSSFTLYCSDPYKHDIDSASIRGVGKVELAKEIPYPDTPDVLTVDVSASTKAVNVTNGRETIRFAGDFKADDEISVHFHAQDKILLNGDPHPEIHDYLSDLENFLVRSPGTISVDPATATIELTLRERYR